MRPSLLMTFVLVVAVQFAVSQARAQSDSLRVSPAGEVPHDSRLGTLRDLNDHLHPWTPPTSLEAWQTEHQRVFEQILVSVGLWPMPEKTPLEPVIHGLIDRGDYTVEKVFFASRPGHYVCGSLYRPKGEGPFPGILCPHGHWANGRFYDAGNEGAEVQLATGAESFMAGAHYPLQARFVQLARMGCVVFHYDMVGYADSQALPHSEGFGDVQAQLELQCLMGLQTWNSIRALDFLESLPDVDPTRIGVTGASGGGTQTFMLCAIDDRPAAAFPAVMVSTNMQGGCVCENANYLRIGINNVAIAACFAPKPMAMSGADDWTIDIETSGLPELKHIYELYDAAAKVNAHCFPQFPHNYNEPAREMMYDFFNAALGLGIAPPIFQTDFWPLSREELTVFDSEHPLPGDALNVADLRDLMTKESRAALAQAVESLDDGGSMYRALVGTAARVMLDQGVPSADEVEAEVIQEVVWEGYGTIKAFVHRTDTGDRVPTVGLHRPEVANGNVILWIHPDGKSSLAGNDGVRPEVLELLDAGYAVVSPDVFLTGEFLSDGRSDRLAVHQNFPAYTFCYNRPVLSQRVRDILSVIGVLRTIDDVSEIHIVGLEEAGPWAALAGAIAGDAVTSTTADLGHFSFADITEVNDPMLLPGALKYGDLDGLVALAAPGTLRLYGSTAQELPITTRAYGDREELTLSADELTIERVVEHFASASE